VLCNAETLVGNQALNQLEIHGLTGALSMSFPLPGKPFDIVYDVSTNTAYATLFGATDLVRVNLGTGTVTTIPLGGIGLRLTLGNGGLVFVTLDDALSFPNRPLVIVNGSTATVEKTLLIPYGGILLTYHKPTNLLYMGDFGLSPSKLERYSYDSAAKTLTLEQSRANTGNNCLNVSIATNGMHLALACSQGNATNPIDYKIHDINPADLDANFGLWNTGPYPVDAVFSPDDTKMVASNGSELRRFDVATHSVLNNFVLTSPCPSSNVRQVAISPGGKINYTLVKCGAIGDSGKLYWFVTP
jgi:DNA-binding beta-propeller fold protein YncE